MGVGGKTREEENYVMPVMGDRGILLNSSPEIRPTWRKCPETSNQSNAEASSALHNFHGLLLFLLLPRNFTSSVLLALQGLPVDKPEACFSLFLLSLPHFARYRFFSSRFSSRLHYNCAFISSFFLFIYLFDFFFISHRYTSYYARVWVCFFCFF
jgi:hypothetical protein